MSKNEEDPPMWRKFLDLDLCNGLIELPMGALYDLRTESHVLNAIKVFYPCFSCFATERDLAICCQRWMKNYFFRECRLKARPKLETETSFTRVHAIVLQDLYEGKARIKLDFQDYANSFIPYIAIYVSHFCEFCIRNIFRRKRR